MPRPLPLLVALPLLGLLSGCLGGSLGGQTALAPTDAGAAALGEGLVGRIPGLSLGADERARAIQAEFQALQFTAAGEPVTWTVSGASGQVVPTQLYRVGTQDCRAFSHVVTANGRQVAGQATACRDAAGAWTVV